MAFQDLPTATMNFSFIDGTGSRGRMKFDIPYATLASVAILGASTVRPLIQAVTGCVIVGQSVVYAAKDNTPAPAALNSRVERKGVMQFLTANSKFVRYGVPGVIDDVLLRSGALNEDRPAVAALINAIVAGGAIFCDSNGIDITQYWGGYERFNSSTRAMLPSDRRPDADILP